MHDYSTMGFVEYLLYFRNDGDYLVSVKFSGRHAWKIATQKASLSEVAALIDILGKEPSAMMLFDEYRGLVKEVRIAPKTKQVTMIVDLTLDPDGGD